MMNVFVVKRSKIGDVGARRYLSAWAVGIALLVVLLPFTAVMGQDGPVSPPPSVDGDAIAPPAADGEVLANAPSASEESDTTPAKWGQKVVEVVVEFAAKYGFSIIGAIIILILGRIVAGLCRRISRKVLTKAKAEQSLVGFVSSLVYYAVLVFAIIAAISKLGVQTASFVAVLGAAGLAVGLALQGSLSNFASGVLILIFRPFKVGDFISASGCDGVVQEIGIFTTTLHSPDNKKIIIPNSGVTGGNITNVTANDTRRVDLTAGISYTDDMERAKQVLEEMLANHPKVLKDPAPTVAVVALADSSVNLVVRPWCKTSDYWEVYFSVTQGIKEALDAADISIPFPQRDVHLFQSGG